MADREGFIKGLKELADWYEQHPEVDAPLYPSVSLNPGSETIERAEAIARALGACEKRYSDVLFSLKRSFGAIEVTWAFWRASVCERRVVGEEHVPEKVIPAHTREIVEWDCHPLLGAS